MLIGKKQGVNILKFDINFIKMYLYIIYARINLINLEKILKKHKLHINTVLSECIEVRIFLTFYQIT